MFTRTPENTEEVEEMFKHNRIRERDYIRFICQNLQSIYSQEIPNFLDFESNLNVKKTSFFTFFTLKPPPLFNNPTWAWQNLFASKTFLSRWILKLRLKTNESHHKRLHLTHWRPHCSAIKLISNGSNFIAVIDNDLRLSKLHFISSSMMYSFN